MVGCASRPYGFGAEWLFPFKGAEMRLMNHDYYPMKKKKREKEKTQKGMLGWNDGNFVFKFPLFHPNMPFCVFFSFFSFWWHRTTCGTPLTAKLVSSPQCGVMNIF